MVVLPGVTEINSCHPFAVVIVVNPEGKTAALICARTTSGINPVLVVPVLLIVVLDAIPVAEIAEVRT